MRTQLLSHNKAAYQKVMRAFETSDRTCVVHPTGTGKSYLIAAVSESFKKVLILGPNTFVLDQVHNVLQWRKDNVEYMTYQMLLYTENPKTDYDLICLDEFHRAGAPGWGDAVDHLLEVNPTIKVLGTTATPIRFLDDNRDMADELFEGNIASYITLKDAWERNILTIPTFVTGLFEFDKVTADMEERIRKSYRINAETKKQRLTRVNNLRLDWERSQGMPQIIRKHIDQHAKRIIVFCGNVEHLKDMEQTVRTWFQKAGFKIANVYTVHGYMHDKDLNAQMDGFESDDFGDGGVKLMLSVNMLNEGVHIPRVNAVILLRTTASKIIYLQQIGRCLTAANTGKPVILDMVDNITTTNLVHDIREGFDWYEHQKLTDEEPKEHEPKNFVVYDYTLGIKEAIEKLVPEEISFLSIEERIAILKAYCEEHGCWPDDNDRNLYRHYIYLNQHAMDNPAWQELRAKYGRQDIVSPENRLAMLEAYIAENDCFPGKEDKEDWNNLQQLRRYHKKEPIPRLVELECQYRIFRKSDEMVKKRFMSFVAEHGRLPQAGKDASRKEVYLRADVRKRKLHINDPEVSELWKKYDTTPIKRTLEEKITLMEAYCKENGRSPRKGNPLRQVWDSMLWKGKDDPRVQYLVEEYGGQGWTKKEMEKEASKIIDFIDKNGRTPSASYDGPERGIYIKMMSLRRNHSDLPTVQRMMEKIDKLWVSVTDEQVKQQIIAFVEKNHCMPSRREGKPEEERKLCNLWKSRYNRLTEDPQMQAIADAYTRKPVKMEDALTKVRDFCVANGRLPRKKDVDVYRYWIILFNNYIHIPSVKDMAEKYGYRHQSPRIDIEGILNDVKAFSDNHGKLPSSAAKEHIEKKLGVRWNRIKRRYADNPKVITLIERFPIQNRK